MEEKKEKVEKKDNRGKHVLLVTVLIVILMGVSCAIGYALGGTKIINIVKEEKIIEQNNPVLTYDLVMDLSHKLDSILKKGGFVDYSKSTNFNSYVFRPNVLSEKLTDQNKQQIILESLSFKGLDGSKWENDERVKSFIDKDPTAKDEFSYLEYDYVNEEYKKFFGEELTNPVADIGMCPYYYYNAENKEFYRSPARCGGTSASNVLIYKSDYELKENEAYVYFYLGATWPREGSVTGYLVYKDYERTELVEETGYGYPNDYSITKDNADKFSQYKAIFKNDGTNNYVFQEIVRVK